MKLLARDLEINTFTAGIGEAKIWNIHILHLPTGIGARREGKGYGMIAAKHEMMNQLRDAIEQ